MIKRENDVTQALLTTHRTSAAEKDPDGDDRRITDLFEYNLNVQVRPAPSKDRTGWHSFSVWKNYPSVNAVEI